MNLRDAELAVEALLVAAPRPVAVAELAAVLTGVDVEAAVASVMERWSGRGMIVERGKDGLKLVPSADAVRLLAEAEGRKGRRLSEAAVSTLAVIAMHQPVTVIDIERLRGIRLSRGILDSLLDAGLIRVSMRRTDAGRAAAYVTTETFLENYDLGSLDDLPTPEEVDDLIGVPSDG